MKLYNCVVVLSLATLAGSGFLLLVSCEPLIHAVGSGKQNYIVTARDSFALTGESLQRVGIASASVNGAAIIKWYNKQCSPTTQSLSSMTPAQRNALYEARNELDESPKPRSRNFQGFFKETQRLAREQNDIVKHEENDFSVSSYQLPPNMARIFVKPNVVVFVYLDGKVDMKPTQCLTEPERSLLNQVRRSPNFV